MLESLARLSWPLLRLDRAHAQSKSHIDSVCIGWSGRVHWKSFQRIFKQWPQIRDICMLGVYYGRDIGYMAALLSQMQRPFRIVGVDLFADLSGDDWPEHKRGLSWEEAGCGPAPEREKAQANIERLGFGEHVELVQSGMDEYLRSCQRTFDFVYIDVNHDYETTRLAIELARRRLKPGGILGGDDFSNLGTWGVARAVKELCPGYRLDYGWVWTAEV